MAITAKTIQNTMQIDGPTKITRKGNEKAVWKMMQCTSKSKGEGAKVTK